MAVPQWGTMTYSKGVAVPLYRYKCKATFNDAKRPMFTHICKIGIDHDGDHECVCGKAWPPLADANK